MQQIPPAPRRRGEAYMNLTRRRSAHARLGFALECFSGEQADAEELGRRRRAELALDARAMELDRLRADEELAGDRARVLAREHALEHGAFALGQAGEPDGRLAPPHRATPRIGVGLERVEDGAQQPVLLERLLDEIERAFLHRLDRHRHVAVPGEEDDRDVDAALEKLLLEREAGHPWHAHVEHDAGGTRAAVALEERERRWKRLHVQTGGP